MKMKCAFHTFGTDGHAYRVEDWRKVIDTTTNHNKVYRSEALGNKPYLRLEDGRGVEWTGVGEFRIAGTGIRLTTDDPKSPQGPPMW